MSWTHRLILSSVLFAYSLHSVADNSQLQSRLDRLTHIMLEQEQQLQKMQENMQQLRGENEMMTHQLQQLDDKQGRLYSDIDQRINDLGQGYQSSSPVFVEAPSPAAVPTEAPATDLPPTTGAATNQAPVETTAITPTPNNPNQTANPTVDIEVEANSYQAAFQLVQSGRYPQAILSLQLFIKNYPQSEYSDNAQYWLGESYYAQRDFQTAIREFNNLIESHPNSAKQAHALLKAAFAYDELQDANNARSLLQRIRREYPNTATARLATERLQRLQGR